MRVTANLACYGALLLVNFAALMAIAAWLVWRTLGFAGARAAEQETAWRSGYLVHLRRLLATPDRARLWLAQTPQGFDYAGADMSVSKTVGT